ncbi:Asp-tRNA(Asn)/Glu-tRNA(Gln) amidotransferase subunit GatA [Alicyclobacillus tolerans]|uniref:Asp-tRNA(Asn)/Glu-tRNA(Gln) amidotransferase subunit GatA n=1 Tax=Alicyclobacillus tolerans TaxID=90970 RepID=UPI001EFFB3A9|nr:Asp-tRNA(Asn)/Glu-tRNA(Gln) amidotransferase subunit GatA [Alicyclobacillus tolerans]MCF8563973.1 Asp-tRNA(Asn)/Glu-tRNA(Gln) amidotransferase subunit GatA [Alicyclobacillus tolerans]
MKVHSVKEILTSLSKKETQPSDWTLATLDNIRQADDTVQAFLTVEADQAVERAKKLDSSEHSSELLFGVPYALKDNMCTQGVRTTAASRILENYIPPYSATVADKLQQQGGVMVGKTNMDEFAMGSSTENSAYRKTRNPYHLDAVPGGSSGGSAAAVAAGMVPFALGSDTGGSIRQPAAYCGVVGLKPTYGRVSRFGLIAFASSLDQIGPFTRTVEDAAYVLQAISGHDPYDSTSAPVEVDNFTAALTGDVRGLKIGVVRDIDSTGLNTHVDAAVQKAIQLLQQQGATVVDVQLPHSKYAVAAYYLIAPAEASSNLARYDGVRYGRRAEGESLIEMYRRTRSEGFGLEVKRRIVIGTYALSSGYYDAYYLRAQKMRTLIRQDFEEAFQACDVIIMPTAPTPAFKFGENQDNPLQMYLNDIYTIPANLAGIPGISLPCGMTPDGLPIGLQILGKAFDEKTLLRVAHAYEQLRGFEMPLPKLEG